LNFFRTLRNRFDFRALTRPVRLCSGQAAEAPLFHLDIADAIP
jgi:hypothetical protein